MIRPAEGWSEGMALAYGAGLAGEACPNGYATAWADGAAHRVGMVLRHVRRRFCDCESPRLAADGFCEECGEIKKKEEAS